MPFSFIFSPIYLLIDRKELAKCVLFFLTVIPFTFYRRFTNQKSQDFTFSISKYIFSHHFYESKVKCFIWGIVKKLEKFLGTSTRNFKLDTRNRAWDGELQPVYTPKVHNSIFLRRYVERRGNARCSAIKAKCCTFE